MSQSKPKTCPTCGQPLLPSMGNPRPLKNTRPAPQGEKQNDFLVGNRLKLTIGRQTVEVDLDTKIGKQGNPRGLTGTLTFRHAGSRYRAKVHLTRYPRKMTVGGRIVLIRPPTVLLRG